MNGNPWVATKTACDFFGVTPQTLRRWAKNDRVEYKRTVGGHRIYKIGYEAPEQPSDSKCFIYIRVSSSKQKDDLERQSKCMADQFPNYRIIKDIGSGLNFKRTGLHKLLEESNSGRVSKIVVASKDRLCRFGVDLLEWQFKQNGTELVVLDKTDESPEEEFTEDILAVLQVFACRWNGKRSYSVKNKKDQIKVVIIPEKGTNQVEPPP